MLDYIAYITVRLLNKIFSLVPISAALWLGRRLGSAAFFFNKKRRLIAYANLKAAFAGEKTPGELKSLTRKVYQNLVQTFVEILSLTKVDKKYVDKYVEIVNFERIQKAAVSGRGAILLTGHFGDWELLSLTSAIVGFPILVLAREQKMKRLNELLNRLRESKGCKVIRKGISVKNILRALNENGIIGILSDQDAGRGGIFVDFFGRPTSTSPGPMEMAKRTDSIIIPNLIVRTNGPYHKVYLEEYIDFRDLKDGDDIKAGLQTFAHILESYIRRFPDQWLWLHKRWKSTPTRNILVLNDGKAGHLNQSIAVANEIRKARTTQGYGPEDTKIVIVDVKFKNGFSRAALALAASFATWRCHGCMRCMGICLEEETYEKLMGTYSEFVVSCGSSVASVNVFMSKENNAKNCVIMNPGILNGLKQFSLAFIPRHDRPPRANNVVITTVAPNMIDAGSLKRGGEALKNILRLEKKIVTGLLIGGDNPEFELAEDIVGKAVEGLLRYCKEYDAELLVTTSRRTPKGIEELLRSRLGNNPRCKLLVIANEKNIEGVVSGILSLSDVVVVSGESISMLSEAISSGKRVVAFETGKKRKGRTKHESALMALEREGYLSISSAQALASALGRDHKKPARKIENSDRIFNAVREII